MFRKVHWNLLQPLVCEKHYEHGPIMACPFPGCVNGVEEDQIECNHPFSDPVVYKRFQLRNGHRGGTFVWRKQENPDLILGFGRLLNRESVRLGLSHRPATFGPIVYHYTSAAGLLGILDSKEIWLTDYRFLNDPSELDHGLALTREAFKKVAKKRKDAEAILEKWGACAFTGHEVCIASFSYAGDSLSQWRAYGPIAIGFDLRDYPGFGALHTAEWRPVIYDADRQRRHLELMAHLVASAWKIDVQNFPDRIDEVYKDGADYILNEAATFKNIGFEDEREIRLIHSVSAGLSKFIRRKQPKRRFRTTGELIVPFVSTIDIRDADPNDAPDKLPIKEIVIGPSPNVETIKNGVALALKSYGYAEVEIRLSQTPLRR